MPPIEQDILTDLRLAVARLEVKIEAMDEKMDSAVVSHSHLEKRLAPLTANINRWKGGMTAIMIVGGAVGGFISTFVKHWVTGTQ